ncbi:MAG: DUF2461 family protein [Gemmataceae bacterium]|nr:DUF2461 family protein [Gemmataceae bacterium]
MRFLVEPLLRQFIAKCPHQLEENRQSVQSARATWLNTSFLHSANDSELLSQLQEFTDDLDSPNFIRPVLVRKVRSIRHALNHLILGRDPFPLRMSRCLDPLGMYHIAGLGLSFWSAIFEALDPENFPSWTEGALAGLARLELFVPNPLESPSHNYTRFQKAILKLKQYRPDMGLPLWNYFLNRIGQMRSREFPCSKSDETNHYCKTDRIHDAIRRVRSAIPLKDRLKGYSRTLLSARAELFTAVKNEDALSARRAISQIYPNLGDIEQIHEETFFKWTQRLLFDAEPNQVLAELWRAGQLVGFGLGLPVAILHIRDPRTYHLWNESTRKALAYLHDGFFLQNPVFENYLIYQESFDRLREDFRVHPLEIPDVLASVMGNDHRQHSEASFQGFCQDSFEFLEELNENNSVEWMDSERSRYHFAVRDPLWELGDALASRYLNPILNGKLGWDIETDIRSGKTLSRITRNDHGRSYPYETVMWIAFYRRSQGSKREDVQLFVRLDPKGLGFGMMLGRAAREAGRCFRKNIQKYAESLYRILLNSGAINSCDFKREGQSVPIQSAADLRHWASGKQISAERFIPKESSLLRREDLVGEIILIFDRLKVAYACAISEEPLPFLEAPDTSVDTQTFLKTTYLSEAWLQQTLDLLSLKKQLLFFGLSGTGKTFTARQLARLLTADDPERIRIVPFHPGINYEEFIERIHQQTTQDGILLQLAKKAQANPSQAYFLLIDGIERSDLGRIFGEASYLLEYRDQEVILPLSRQPFRIPENLYLLATMGISSHKNLSQIDSSHRRRFAFVEMHPNPDMLRAWFADHPPHEPELAEIVPNLLELINQKIKEDMGIHHSSYAIGHTYFMVEDLDRNRLETIWNYHIIPQLEEMFPERSQLIGQYQLNRLLKGVGIG